MAKHRSIFVIFCVILQVFESTACTNQDPCLCIIDKHKKIDLTPLLNEAMDKDTFLYDDDENNNRYYFHGCRDAQFDPSKHHLNPNTTTKDVKGSLITVNTGVPDKATVTAIGTRNNMTLQSIENEKDTYQIVYRNGINVTATIRLICIELQDSFIKILSVTGTNPILTLSSRFACVQIHEDGLSSGSIFLILLLVSFGVYLGGGCCVMYFIRGARGLEMIPNIDFWRNLPGLVKDGVIFLFSGCNPHSISASETYDRI